MKRSFILIFVFAFKAVAQSESLSAPGGTNELLVTPALIAQWAEEARTNNPALQAVKVRVKAAQANEQSIRGWEDPMVELGLMPAEREMRAGEGDLIVGVEQKLPLFGKFQAAQRLAAMETKVEEANEVFQFQQLRKEIAVAVFKTALMDRKVAINEQDLTWLETLLAVAEPRYAIGEASQMDVLRLQNERAKRVNQLKNDGQLLQHERAVLNRRLARHLDSPWPKLRLPDVAQSIVYNSRLINLALNNEPRLKMMQWQSKQAKTAMHLTRRQRLPDFTVGAEMRNSSETGEFRQGMLTLGFNFPWGNGRKYEADWQRDRAKWQAAELEAKDYAWSIHDEVHGLTVKIDSARREALLYQEQIIPRTQTVIKSTHIAWESGGGSLEDLLDAHRMLLEGQLMHARSVAEQYELLSELVLCCGLGDLEALETFNQQAEIPPTQ